MIAALKGFIMADAPPTPDEAVASFLHAIMWACVFGTVEAIIADKPWSVSITVGLTGLACHIVGIKWPNIKLKLGPRFARAFERVAGSAFVRGFALGLAICALVFGAILIKMTKGVTSPPQVHQIQQDETPSIGNGPQPQAYSIKVVNENGTPLKGAEVLFIRKDGVHSSTAVTNDIGIAEVTTLKEVGALFCAMSGFHSYYKKDYEPTSPLTIGLRKTPLGGSIIFADGTGYIPDSNGRLNPILDTSNRTYLYAENIAIDGGKTQPVTFVVGSAMTLEDRGGHTFRVVVSSIISSSSLIDYQRIK